MSSQFSILRLLRDVQARGAQGKSDELRACVARAATFRDRVPRGYFLPADALDPIETRDIDLALQGGTPAGYAPGTVVASSLSPALRPRRWSIEAGVVEVSGLEGNGEIVLPVETTEAAGTWIGDGASAPEAEPGTSGVAVSPRTVTAWSRITRGMLMQSSVSAENWVRSHLQASCDDAVDRALLAGSGLADDPMGIVNTPGVGSVQFATSGQPTRAELVSLFSAAAKADADPRRITFVAGPTMAETLRETSVDISSGRFLLERESIEGDVVAKTAPLIETSHCPDGVVVAGDFTQAVCAKWADPLDIIVNPFGAVAMGGGVDVHVFLTADAAACQRKAFAVGR